MGRSLLTKNNSQISRSGIGALPQDSGDERRRRTNRERKRGRRGDGPIRPEVVVRTGVFVQALSSTVAVAACVTESDEQPDNGAALAG
jgi:hypothetical protein